MNELKQRLIKKLIKKNVRKYHRVRFEYKNEVFEHQLVVDKWKNNVGYVERIISSKGNIHYLLIYLFSVQLSYDIMRGHRKVNLSLSKYIKSSFDEQQENILYFWKYMKKKYKQNKKLQERTRRLRLQGKIGRKYFEEY
jgi:hypothetical protein